MDDRARQRPDAVANLREAVRRARLDDADRSTAAADLKAAEQIRLEILRDALAPILAELPEDAALFDHGIVPGDRPRLHIDILAFVDVAEDRRQYRLVQDTRWGQRVMAETDDIQTIIRAVTDYVALRLVEREKALRSDSVQGSLLRHAVEPRPLLAPATPSRPAIQAEPPRVEPNQPAPASIAPLPAGPVPRRTNPAVAAFLWFALGTVVGGLAILAVGIIRARGLM